MVFNTVVTLICSSVPLSGGENGRLTHAEIIARPSPSIGLLTLSDAECGTKGRQTLIKLSSFYSLYGMAVTCSRIERDGAIRVFERAQWIPIGTAEE